MVALMLFSLCLHLATQSATYSFSFQTTTTKPTLTTLDETESNLSKPDTYPCPKRCTCKLFTDPDRLLVDCALFILGTAYVDFSIFSGFNFPSRLLLYCDAPVNSNLEDEMFVGLHVFDELKIKNCAITNVSSEAFKGLTSLKTLVIEGGVDTKFDNNCLKIPDLSNLEAVSITDTNTRAAPSMCDLDKLWYVNLSHNGIEDFANTGLKCDKPTRIKTIDISKNELRSLVDNFDGVTNDLEYLSASYNRISHISPYIFKNLTQLQVLELDHNNIFPFPEGFIEDNKKLMTLTLSHNNVGKIPKNSFIHLQGNLLLLRVEQMGLEDSIWLELLNLANLKGLYLNGNPGIKTVCKRTLFTLQNLQVLEISNNSITEIESGTFEEQRNLCVLNASSNEIKSVYGGSFRGLMKLNTLDLKYNQIQHFQHDALLPLTSLLVLNLSYNLIQEVPKLPVSLIGIDLRHNDITTIKEDDFAGLGKLQGINLRFNRIAHLPRNALASNVNLQLLQLSHNCLTEIDYHTFPKSSPLEVLILNHNSISDIQLSFAPEYFTKLKTLDLSYNNITILMPPMLGKLFPDSLEELFLSWNKISVLQSFIFKLPNLRVVDLKGNKISSITNLDLEVFENKLNPVVYYLSVNPFNCDCRLAWLKEAVRLQSEMLGFGYIVRDLNALYCLTTYRHKNDLLINIPVENFLCTYEENCYGRCPDECCFKDDCPCRTFCPANCTCYRSLNRMDIDVIDCVDANLKSIPNTVSPVVTTFELSRNNFPIIFSQTFKSLSRLKDLKLDFCEISDIDEGAFDGLANLTSLNLGNNLLKSLNTLMFKGLVNVSTLTLQFNNIYVIAEKTFEALSALTYLDLSGNNLSEISVFEFKRISYISRLKLALNPWTCECSYLERMKNFTIMHAHNILDFNDVACVIQNSSTGLLERHTLAEVHLPDFCENETIIYNQTNIQSTMFSRSAIAAVTTVLSVTFLCIVAFGIIFWNRAFLKVWCFVKFGWKFAEKDAKDETNRPYDAFVSYSSHDEDFIVRELVPYLEEGKQGRKGYRLCVHFRDFAVGASIAESIISAVELSKRVIIVLSENFLNSEWCQYEFQTAHHQLLEERKNRIIMILLQDLNLDMDDHQLRDYLKTRTYLKYDDPWFWAKLEYAMPKLTAPDTENRNPADTVHQPDEIPDCAGAQDIDAEDEYNDNDMQYIIDNMKNYEADDPKLYAFEVEIDQ